MHRRQLPQFSPTWTPRSPALEARRDKTRDLKQAMMQELLAGRTRLVEPEADPCLSDRAPSAGRRTVSSRSSPIRRDPIASATATSATGATRENNRAIETDAVAGTTLRSRGYSGAHIAAALRKLESAADSTGTTLYRANLRYPPAHSLWRPGTDQPPERPTRRWNSSTGSTWTTTTSRLPRR